MEQVGVHQFDIASALTTRAYVNTGAQITAGKMHAAAHTAPLATLHQSISSLPRHGAARVPTICAQRSSHLHSQSAFNSSMCSLQSTNGLCNGAMAAGFYRGVARCMVSTPTQLRLTHIPVSVNRNPTSWGPY